MCTSFNEVTDVISSHISFCVDSVIPSKHITIFPNNKPWVTKDLKGVLNKKKRVFFQGTTDEKKQVNREVRGAIRKAKEKYRKKIESKFRAVAVFVLLGKVSGTWQLLTRRLHLVGQGSVWRRWLMRHAKPHEQFLHSFRNT